MREKESDKFYKKLLKMEPLGFIDPLKDLGTCVVFAVIEDQP